MSTFSGNPKLSGSQEDGASQGNSTNKSICFQAGSAQVRSGKSPTGTVPKEQIDSSSDESWCLKQGKKALKLSSSSDELVSDDMSLSKLPDISGMGKWKPKINSTTKKAERNCQLPQPDTLKHKGKKLVKRAEKKSVKVKRTPEERKWRRMAHQERVELRVSYRLLRKKMKAEKKLEKEDEQQLSQ